MWIPEVIRNAAAIMRDEHWTEPFDDAAENGAVKHVEKQSASEKRRLLDFAVSNSAWGNDELAIEFRQRFALIALGASELKQKKAAGVGSDDLYQLKYTPEDSNL